MGRWIVEEADENTKLQRRSDEFHACVTDL